MARILADHMRTTLGQNIVIENVTGAAGSLGVGRVVRAAPDGYTVSIGHLGTHVANGAIYKLGYDLVADLEPVVLLPSNPMIIVSNNAVPAKIAEGADRVAEGEADARPRQAPRAPVREATSPGSISKTSPASSCNMCPIAARRRR